MAVVSEQVRGLDAALDEIDGRRDEIVALLTIPGLVLNACHGVREEVVRIIIEGIGEQRLQCLQVISNSAGCQVVFVDLLGDGVAPS